MQFEPTCGAEALFESTNEGDIALLEGLIGKSLPEDYKRFLLEWNGVVFNNDWASQKTSFITWSAKSSAPPPVRVSGISREDLEESWGAIDGIKTLLGVKQEDVQSLGY